MSVITYPEHDRPEHNQRRRADNELADQLATRGLEEAVAVRAAAGRLEAAVADDIGHDAANKVVPFGLHRAG